MKKTGIFLILCSLVFSAKALTVADGEEDEQTDNMMHLLTQNRELTDSIGRLNKKLGDADKTIKVLQANNAKQQEDLDKLRNLSSKKNIDAYKDSITKLNKVLVQVQDSLVKLRMDSDDAIAGAAEAANAAADSARRALTLSEAEVARLRQEVAEMEEFREAYVRQMADNFSDTWANIPYSAINPAALDNALAQYGKYAATDASIAAAAKALQQLKEEHAAYVKASDAVTSLYDRANVVEAAMAVTKAMKTATKARAAELEPLRGQLGSYKSQVEAFQKLIGEIDAAAAQFSNHNSAKRPVNKVREANEATIAEIRKNPWLEKQMDAYLQGLDKNCTEQTAVRQAILDLKVK